MLYKMYNIHRKYRLYPYISVQYMLDNYHTIPFFMFTPPHAVSWFDQPLSRHCIWREKHLATRLLIRDLAFWQGLGDLRHPMEEILVCWSGGCWSHLILRFFWGTTFLLMKLETRRRYVFTASPLRHDKVFAVVVNPQSHSWVLA